MIELSDWIWLAVVVLWLATRIVPRLFGSRSRQTQSSPGPEPRRVTGTPAQRLPDFGGAQPIAQAQPEAKADPRLRSSEPIQPK